MQCVRRSECAGRAVGNVYAFPGPPGSRQCHHARTHQNEQMRRPGSQKPSMGFWARPAATAIITASMRRMKYDAPAGQSKTFYGFLGPSGSNRYHNSINAKNEI